MSLVSSSSLNDWTIPLKPLVPSTNVRELLNAENSPNSNFFKNKHLPKIQFFIHYVVEILNDRTSTTILLPLPNVRQRGASCPFKNLKTVLDEEKQNNRVISAN
jgi:hypothetical protein